MSDKEIIEYMNEKDSIRAEMLQDELHERNMRDDINYFLKHSEFEEFKDMYQKLSQKALKYGWCDFKVKVKDLL